MTDFLVNGLKVDKIQVDIDSDEYEVFAGQGYGRADVLIIALIEAEQNHAATCRKHGLPDERE